jgi:hypothetical protein
MIYGAILVFAGTVAHQLHGNDRMLFGESL